MAKQLKIDCAGVRVSGYWKGNICGAYATRRTPDGRYWCHSHVPEGQPWERVWRLDMDAGKVDEPVVVPERPKHEWKRGVSTYDDKQCPCGAQMNFVCHCSPDVIAAYKAGREDERAAAAELLGTG